MKTRQIKNLARLRLRPTRRVYCYHIAEDLARLATLVNDGQMQARLVVLAQSSLHGHRLSKATTVSAECGRAIESRQTRQQVAEGLVHRSTLVHTTAASPLAWLRVGLTLQASSPFQWQRPSLRHLDHGRGLNLKLPMSLPPTTMIVFGGEGDFAFLRKT